MKNLLLISFCCVFFHSGFAGVGGSIGGTGGTKEIRFPWGHRLVTLEDYDKSFSYVVHWPSVKFGNLSTTVNNVCSDGELFKTITPLKVCTRAVVIEVCDKTNSKGNVEECHKVRSGEEVKEKYGRRFVWGCESTIDKDFETSKFYQAPVCLKWGQDASDSYGKRVWSCLELGQETREYSEKYSVNVTPSGNTKNKMDQPEINLDFEIPACK